MIKGSDQNEPRGRRRSFRGGFFVLCKRLMFDVRAGTAEPLSYEPGGSPGPRGVHAEISFA